MLRSRLLQTTFSRLALVAVLLMVLAPLLSRALQAAPGYSEMCTQAGLSRVALALPQTTAMALPLTGAAKAFTADAGHEGMACDYCMLAARLLPVLLCLLAFLPCLRVRAPASARAVVPVVANAWPAHPARGPPLYA